MRPLFLLRPASMAIAMVGVPQAVHAAYSCNVTATSVGVLYVQGSNTDTTGSVTLTCTRSSGDAGAMTYRIKADNGMNYAGGTRRVRLGATANRLNYALRRGTAPGGAAACGNNSNWAAPNNGTNTMTGTLNFGTAMTASVTWGFCIRVRGNQGSPAGGSYTDTVQVFAQYPGTNGSPVTPWAALGFTVGVNNQCVFNTQPAPIVFDYTSFSPVPRTASRSFDLRCSTNLPWAISISPDTGTLLGLNYDLDPNPETGIGTGADQAVTVTGTVPAGQAGTCSTASCSATQPHSLIVTY